MKLKQLIKDLEFRNTRTLSLADFEVEGISANSKQVRNNFVFVAVKGPSYDGNRFIDEAINNGARAVVSQELGVGSRESRIKADRVTFVKVKDTREALGKLAAKFYGNPSSKIKVIGITGTNGKTTITYLIEAILKKAGFLPAVIGTINYRFKDTIIPSKNTTPGPVELQSMLCDMSKAGADYCLMEVSSHALEQKRTEGIDFHSAIFTNLTQDHLDYHRTMKNYFKAKARLFKGLDRDAYAVLNNDDKFSRSLKRMTKARIVTYGLRNKPMLTIKKIKFDCSHTEFLLSSLLSRKEEAFKTGLIGRHNLYNILASIAWAEQEGIPLEKIKSAIEEFSFVPGRLQRVAPEQKFTVFVDYAHTEDALKNILKALRQIAKRMIIVVFGCGGNRDSGKRPKMGRIVSQLADYAIITNDNPRSEAPEKIIEDIKKGIVRKNYCIIPDRYQAIRKSLSLAKAKDIVLIAGKGHENYQIINGRTMHFDDRMVVRECLKLMN